ncbi:hypothetical protein ANN_20935 [Periplaneta americana]|uniref:Uncharacterized protein n=1 Tax=Periplaneta americana TaxID=6978 RepID=A0ABQ8SEU4_PERAM|nr:hypothetical protein ANN_20935 [Periplaneta americana]
MAGLCNVVNKPRPGRPKSSRNAEDIDTVCTQLDCQHCGHAVRHVGQSAEREKLPEGPGCQAVINSSEKKYKYKIKTEGGGAAWTATGSPV